MQQRPNKFDKADGDPETTLVAPRFDAEEARRAHPVVPLAEAGANAPHAGAYARRGPRRSWTTALLVVALFAVAAVGGAVATMFMRRTPSTPTAEQTPAAVAPAQAAEVPAQVEPPPAVPATTREVADTNPREVADAKSETRARKESRARREEDAPVRARDEDVRDDRKGFEDEDKRGRGRGKGRERRRERGEDEVEKEMNKALRRARDKAPRLVDVIVRPGN